MEKKRSLSLMQKMTLWFILIILLPSCVLSVVLCRALTDRAYDILVEDHYAVLGIARESISRSAASVESMVEMLSLNAELNKLLTDSKQTPYQRVVKILFDVGDTVAQAQLMLSGLDARVTLFSEDERIPETYWNFLRLKRLDSLPQYERFLLAGETRGWGGIGPVYPTETVLRPAGNPQMLCYYQKLLAGFGECVGVIQCGVSPQKIFSSLQIEGNADVHYYVLQGGEVIYQSDAEQALPEEYRPEESRQIIRRQLYLSRPLESMGLSLVMRLDYGQLHSQQLLWQHGHGQPCRKGPELPICQLLGETCVERQGRCHPVLPRERGQWCDGHCGELHVRQLLGELRRRAGLCAGERLAGCDQLRVPRQ